MMNTEHNKRPAALTTPVLLIFFNRPETFGRVFEQVREARPAHLFLYQDGSRGEKDDAGVMACREICSDEKIDWDCEVHRLFQEKNYGCDPSEFISQRWAFSIVDRCIVLEDDDVPSQGFFTFCEEMLERYKDDERVTMIAGFNVEEKSPCKESYFFTSVFSIWGWASWSRVVNNWDGDYRWLDDPAQVKRMEDIINKRRYKSDLMQMCREHKASGKAHYETIFWSYMLLNGGLSVMPSVNMISNIGLECGTHYSTTLKTLPAGLRRIFTMGRHDLTLPLVHPTEIKERMEYKETFYKVHAWDHPGIKVYRSLEELILNLRYGNFSVIAKAIKNRIKKLTSPRPFFCPSSEASPFGMPSAPQGREINKDTTVG